MSRVILFGYGKMGRAVAYGLHALGHAVTVVDKQFSDKVDPWYRCRITSQTDFQEGGKWEKDLLDNYDLVVSCMPYIHNFAIAIWAIKNGMAYVDLGGHVPTSKDINNYAAKTDVTVFTDIGLAPGLVNILAEQAYFSVARQERVVRVSMKCGGIPVFYKSNDPINHAGTWSIEGLINEYIDRCEVLWPGGVIEVDGMTGLERYSPPDGKGYSKITDPLECFYTSGGAAHSVKLMQDRGVQFCDYKTIRYVGHRDNFQYLYHRLGPDIVKLFREDIGTDQIDKILIDVSAEGQHLQARYFYDIRAFGEWSAMQRATAFPAVAICNQILSDGYITTWRPLGGPDNVLTYRNVALDQFQNDLKVLGLEL